jgi:crossover junction endodeoxyribonuclease RusA
MPAALSYPRDIGLRGDAWLQPYSIFQTHRCSDIDNIVKPILDALGKHIYVDDSQVERVVVQKFEPGNVFPFTAPTITLEEALNRPKPLLYVRLSVDPFEELS